MKNNKGITLISLVIYIAVIFVVIAVLMRVTTYFSNNMQEAANVSFETEFNKLNLYLLDESKQTGNEIQEIAEDGTQILFSNGNTYLYNEEDKVIYLNGTIKICESIESCFFEQEIAENGKNVIVVTVQIEDTTKTGKYVIANYKKEQRINELDYTWNTVGEEDTNVVE